MSDETPFAVFTQTRDALEATSMSAQDKSLVMLEVARRRKKVFDAFVLYNTARAEQYALLNNLRNNKNIDPSAAVHTKDTIAPAI